MELLIRSPLILQNNIYTILEVIKNVTKYDDVTHYVTPVTVSTHYIIMTLGDSKLRAINSRKISPE